MDSRTKNATRNVVFSLSFQLLNIILKFGMRTVFILCLGKEYLGISGVFTNILTVLSIAEMGISTAIVYDMYNPISENNTRKIAQLIDFFKTVYRIIGFIIFGIGIILIPFLDIILTDIPNVKHVQLIYVLFLIKTVSTYFFAQYNSIICAYQKNYIITKYDLIFAILKVVSESILLLVTRSFEIYLIQDIFLTYIYNFVIYKKAIKLFPFIRNMEGQLSRSEKRKIFSNAMCNFSRRFSSTVITSTDNILMSSMVSTVIVGIYSNYLLIIDTVAIATVSIRDNLVAGIGNLCVNETIEKKYFVFSNIFFSFGFLYSLVSAEMVVVLQLFIEMWAGYDYVLSVEIVFVAILNLYIRGMKQPIEMFVSADGLFEHFKIMPWLNAFLNILLSIILGSIYGIIGILLGTTISTLITSLWYEGYIVFKKTFEKSVFEYFKVFIIHFVLAFFNSIISNIICNKIGINNTSIIDILLCLVIGFITVCITYSIVMFRTSEYKYWLVFIKRTIGGIDKLNSSKRNL